MKQICILLCFALTACDRNHASHGSTVHHVPDHAQTGWLMFAVVAALVLAAVVERWMRGDKP